MKKDQQQKHINTGQLPETGLLPEYDFSKGTRGKYAGRPGNKPKTLITIYLDADIIAHFKKLAAQPGAAPYQTQINTALRRVMKSGPGWTVEDVLNDEEFMSALADRVRIHLGL